MIKLLMIGVDKNRLGGMWTVASNYIKSFKNNPEIEMNYIATSTNGTAIERFLFMIKGLKEINRALNNNIDIVHIHMAEKGSTFRKLMIIKLVKRYNTKVIIHMHAGPYMKWFNTLSLRRKNKIIKTFKEVDMFLVLGSFWKEELSQIVNRNKIEILYNGTNVLESNQYTNTGKYISYFGVFKKEKGIYDLLNAVKLINTKIPKDIKVVLCGIDLEGNIQKTIDDLNLQERVKVLGWIDGLEKEKVLKNSLISILPSYYEGLSMSIIESMARGIPVITTNISTMPELFGSDKYLIEPGKIDELADMIEKFVFSSELRLEMSNIEFKRVKEIFSIEKNINITLELYKKLLGSV